MTDQSAGKERTLVRDNEVLREFDESESPDLLALYRHYRDQAFDCFNAAEYHEQMLRYYAADISVRVAVPRKIGDNDYFLVCLQNKQPEKDTLCEVAFQCGRSFVGISMLVKKRCFVCHRQDAKRCSACQCACFCSKECQLKGWGAHKALCKLVKAGGPVTVEVESLQLKPS